MPKNTQIRTVLIIGSGPIVIGQAAEFDYAGTQACLALKEEGYRVILVNSNPATIMTDAGIADRVYMEPLTLEYVSRIIRKERPDALVPGIGGQTGLNLAMELEKSGVLAECGVELLGTPSASIARAEDRAKFKEMCESIGEPVIASQIAYSLEEGLAAAHEIGYPVVLRPAFTLGGTGGGFAHDDAEFTELMVNALALSPVGQVLVEKSVLGYKEIEFEVMRDSADNVVCICSMENIDPVGVHTGDSAVVAPALSVSEPLMKRLVDSAFAIIRALDIWGGCNVQYAVHPETGEYYFIEVNPRVSRSSALASKASGYPIARVSAKVAVGMHLDEIEVAGATAAKDPVLDYLVAKFPRFPFDKFTDASAKLGTQMKATGEVMGIGSTLDECLLKSVRSLETGVDHLWMAKFAGFSDVELREYLSDFRSDTLFAVAELLRRGAPIADVHELTAITEVFLESFARIVAMEKRIADAGAQLALAGKPGVGGEPGTDVVGVLREAKEMGFADSAIARLAGVSETEVAAARAEAGIRPVFRMVDTLKSGAYIPYFYSSYAGANDSIITDRKKIVVVGAGPIRIGQGVEFDYSSVHAVRTIREAGYEAIIINDNPETVSTDYTTADKLYFDPLTVEDVMEIVEAEKPIGVITSLGGQTAINLAAGLAERGAPLIGTSLEALERAEDRDRFEKLLRTLDIPQAPGEAVTDVDAGLAVAARVGYPVLVRPSFVLGGRAMRIVASDDALATYLREAFAAAPGHPVLVDKYIAGKELEVDAICDGTDVFVGGIMELVEHTGVHSGDSISVYPTFTVSDAVKGTILRYAKALGLGIGIRGLFNVQFIVDAAENVYIIEVNPRSSRTVPFLSKVTGVPLPAIATRVILGESLKEQGIFTLYPNEPQRFFVKAPVFSFNKIKGLDAVLSPEMKSTGEAIGYDSSLKRALYKALEAAGMKLAGHGTVLATIADHDKPRALELVRRFYELGFNIAATAGTAQFLKENGIRTRAMGKISEGSSDIEDAIMRGEISYIVNTSGLDDSKLSDGVRIRAAATEHAVTLLTSLDTVGALLDVLEDITIPISTIDADADAGLVAGR
ncbi:carbamoyl-phosphate synthase large subunit [Arcanobacterium wilhelmae]|uniref:Carbamoyl phosphate synthase large chain n=1 Tax=Arcanobacterium wilhelmae TaxID=1803177 RepID=A0ABT9NAI0_9ACTO|nr:carbamoyl-phosphate synthase large subunit [Arcanobacterium wilhelmae]MDP9800719.1 carbamoyl-phosphate synthase large subunit [Arcanobacterium wilhelmae]WFN90118.1 carbamoyl-phosphate synthase large subunit [Arcanobacterium wilhelmae]